MLVAPAAVASASVLQQLTDMVESMRNANFEGVYVHVRGDVIETMEVVHINDGRHEFERLTSLTGEKREILRDDNTCRCTWPDQRTVIKGYFPGAHAKISVERFSNPGLLQENYQIVSAGFDRVAGRDCKLIALVPKDALRYGYKLCVDQDHGLILRLSVFNEEGVAVEHNFFTTLTIYDEPLPVGAYASRVDNDDFEVVRGEIASRGETAAAPTWKIDPLPKGYELKNYLHRVNPVTQNQFEHYVYTDGLATISVFIEQVGEDEHPLPKMRMSHAMNTQTRFVDGYRVTVIGEAPQRVVELFCQNARPISGH